MFGKNTYLLPQLPSSANGVEIFLHHHPDFFSGHYLPSNAHLLNQENSGGPSAAPPAKKQAGKKDRHSKIYTSQGPRDRRVRLSIGIARKFFDLQEMLGFDKPSKTLDWLLTKSKAAIKELVQSKNKATATASSDCELLSPAETSADSKAKEKGGASNLAKESRAKARARARERTREKMCIKQLNITSGFPVPLQNRNNEVEFFQLSAGNKPLHSPLITNQDLVQESVVIKRKTKTPSFQQNVVVSRDSTSNYAIPSENWDVGSFSSQSNMYAILDQHKFINSNSNI